MASACGTPNISEVRLLMARTALSRSRLTTAGNGLMSKSCSKRGADITVCGALLANQRRILTVPARVREGQGPGERRAISGNWPRVAIVPAVDRAPPGGRGWRVARALAGRARPSGRGLRPASTARLPNHGPAPPTRRREGFPPARSASRRRRTSAGAPAALDARWLRLRRPGRAAIWTRARSRAVLTTRGWSSPSCGRAIRKACSSSASASVSRPCTSSAPARLGRANAYSLCASPKTWRRILTFSRSKTSAPTASPLAVRRLARVAFAAPTLG